MHSLKPITLDLKPAVDRLFEIENSRSADFCFGNVYMWDKRFKQSVTLCGDRLVTLLHRKGELFFAFPVGSGDIRPSFEFMQGICDRNALPLRICGVCEEHLALINEAYPDEFEVTEDRDFSDYIYEIDKLAEYPGRHLHAKRNYCNRFEAEHKWSFEPITVERLPDCLDMLDKWTHQSQDRLTADIGFEHDAIVRGFESFDELGLEGGMLIADGRLAGFTVGEVINSDTFCTHFEKAYTDIDGAYTMLCREMARMVMAKHPDVRYVNREDDMGNPALRTSKLSYKPEEILIKYIVRSK